MPTLVAFKNWDTGAIERHDVAWYRDFIDAHVHQAGLQIGPHLGEISHRPVFVVAATGVGKTVAVPVHLFVSLCDALIGQGRVLEPAPCVIVVEPTIPICRSEAEHMNLSFQAFLASRGFPTNVHPFGAVTGTYKSNIQAPIRFVTTGVFELLAKRIDPARCRVVIDEAHRVLAQSPGVEIAACIARDRGIVIDWMSATVDTSDLVERFGVDLVLATEQRYPILKVPTHVPLEECVGDVVLRCLVRPTEIVPPVETFQDQAERRSCDRARQHLLSLRAFEDPVDGATYPGLTERAQGMLVVVNSHQGENSDTRRIADRIRATCNAAGADVEVLRLASPVVRDPDQEASFRRRVAGVEARHGRYVVVATNVVEMGVTFPSLDYVLTMDSELESMRVEGGEAVQERPLGVNAFFQRIGRVGRRRPGMALLTREGARGAAFSAWSSSDLTERLQLEPISFAISRGDVRELAFSLYERQVAPDLQSVKSYLARQRMPSRPEHNREVLRALVAERESIKAVGFSDDGHRLNERGRQFRKIGVVGDLELGSLLAYCIEVGGGLQYLALVSAANPGGLRELLGRHTWLEDDEPSLSHIVPFARDQFQQPLDNVVRELRSNTFAVDARSLGTDDVTAHHLSELIAEGYRVDEPRSIKRDGRLEEPALLTLSRATIRLDPLSELLAAYDVVRWFIVRYRADLADHNLADHERERVRAALREEARDLGLDASRIVSVISRVGEIARHAGINLGTNQPAPRMPDELLSRLASLYRAEKADTGTRTRRTEILRIYRQSLRPRPTAAMPETTVEERKGFVRAIDQLGLFVKVNLNTSEDARGFPIYHGTALHVGASVDVTIERSRSSLRFPGPTAVRGRVIPLTYVDSNGKDTVRYVLSLASAVV